MDRSIGGSAEPRADISYDAGSRITQIQRSIGGTGTTLVSDFGYDNLDRITTMTNAIAGGATLASCVYTYDVSSRLATETWLATITLPPPC